MLPADDHRLIAAFGSKQMGPPPDRVYHMVEASN
jgi:hypothetical protein